jgi:hypothetical protein
VVTETRHQQPNDDRPSIDELLSADDGFPPEPEAGSLDEYLSQLGSEPVKEPPTYSDQPDQPTPCPGRGGRDVIAKARAAREGGSWLYVEPRCGCNGCGYDGPRKAYKTANAISLYPIAHEAQLWFPGQVGDGSVGPAASTLRRDLRAVCKELERARGLVAAGWVVVRRSSTLLAKVILRDRLEAAAFEAAARARNLVFDAPFYEVHEPVDSVARDLLATAMDAFHATSDQSASNMMRHHLDLNRGWILETHGPFWRTPDGIVLANAAEALKYAYGEAALAGKVPWPSQFPTWPRAHPKFPFKIPATHP